MSLREKFTGDRNYAISFTLFVTTIALVLGSLFLISKTVTEIKAWSAGDGTYPTSTISVDASAEVVAVPDVSTFTFGIVEEAESVELAQEEATRRSNLATAFLEENGIAEEDIKTVGFNANPRYEYGFCNGVDCPPQQRQLIAYEVSIRTQVKVRDVEKAGEILAGLTAQNVTNVSGLTFDIDDPDALKEEARSQAIEKARAKAERLADELGVKLKKVVNFSEDTGGHPEYYESYGFGGAGDARVESAVAPDISPGENTVTSRVFITYEIK